MGKNKSEEFSVPQTQSMRTAVCLAGPQTSLSVFLNTANSTERLVLLISCKIMCVLLHFFFLKLCFKKNTVSLDDLKYLLWICEIEPFYI